MFQLILIWFVHYNILFSDNHGNHKDHYKTRLENLQMRQEILVTEQNILLTKQNQVTKRLQQEHTQSLNIKRQEDEIEKSISDLQVRLKGLKELRWVILSLSSAKLESLNLRHLLKNINYSFISFNDTGRM